MLQQEHEEAVEVDPALLRSLEVGRGNGDDLGHSLDVGDERGLRLASRLLDSSDEESVYVPLSLSLSLSRRAQSQ